MSEALRPCAEPEALPDQCRACDYVTPCADGYRNWAGLVEHQGKRVDYLAGYLLET